MHSKYKYFFSLLLIFNIQLAVAQQIDKKFSPVIQGKPYVFDHAVQNDGKVLLCGNINSVDSTFTSNIIRINSNGSLDSTFNSPKLDSKIISSIYSVGDSLIFISSYQGGAWILNNKGDIIENYSNGIRLIPAKDAYYLQTSPDLHIIKYSFNRILDQSFAPVKFDNFYSDIAIQRDNKIIVAGLFNTVNGQTYNNIVRIMPDGSIDESFNIGLGANGEIVNVEVDNDDKIIISGFFSTYKGLNYQNGFLRLNEDGSVDTNFDLNPTFKTINQYVVDFEVNSDNSIIILGRSGEMLKLFKVNIDGTLSSSFSTSAINYLHGRIHKYDSAYTLSGEFTTINDQRHISFAIIDESGLVNNKINPGLGYIPTIKGGYLQPDNKLLVYGDILSVNGKPRNGVARFNENSSLDDFNLQLTADDEIRKVEELPDGNLLLSGNFPSMGLNRKLIKTDMNGNPDYSFDVEVFGTIEDFMIMPESDNDYSIVIAGNFQNINYFYINNLAKLSTEGTLIKSFNTNDIIHSPVKQIDTLANGNIIIAGHMMDPIKGFLLQTPPNADTITFDLKPFEEVLESILYISTDTILVGGFNSNFPSRVYHINYKGNILNNSNIQINSMDGVFHDLLVLPDQSVLIGGRFTQLNSVNQQGLARSELNGQIWNDYSLNLNGERNYVSNFVRADDNHVYVMGYFEGINNVTRTSLAKLRLEHIYPSIDGLKSKIVINEDSLFKLTIDSLKINLGYVPLEEIVMNLLEGNNYTIINDTIIPDQNFYGILNIGVQLHDGYDLSEKSSISLEVLPINDPPIIIDQKNIPSFRADEEVTINLNTLEIEDPDSENFLVHILEGDYYLVINNSTFIIDKDYIGDMSVNVQVTDQDTLSNVFTYMIIAEEPLGLISMNANSSFFYPNPASNFIKISNAFSNTEFKIEIIDFKGKLITNRYFQHDPAAEINVENMPSGIYLIKYIFKDDTYMGKLIIN